MNRRYGVVSSCWRYLSHGSKKRREGSAAVAVLLTGIFLAAAAQLAAWYCSIDYAATVACLRGFQLRSLCASYIKMLGANGLGAEAAGEMQLVLQPGNVPATLRTQVLYNNDGLLRLLKVTASAADADYVLNQLSFSLPAEDVSVGSSYALVSAQAISGTEYVPAGTYTSQASISLPKVDYFKSWSMSGLTMDTLRTIGLCGRAYYIESSSDLKITAGMKIYGGGIIAANGNIVVGKNCRFLERVVLLSTRGIVLEEGAQLPQATLLAHGKITIGSGCTFGGVALAGSNIEINGNCTITHLPELLQPYVSVYYII